MGAVDTTYTFTATDTITSTKMNNIIDQTTITTDAIIGTTLEVATGKLKIRAAGITSNEMGSNSVTTNSITDLNVTTGKIADLAITTGKIADLGVTTAKIADSNVTTVKISDSNITAPKLDGSQTGLAPIFGVRAWVNFDAQRDSSGASNTSNTNRYIRASGNVSRVLKDANGLFTVTFITPMPNNGYAVSINTSDISSGTGLIPKINTSNLNSEPSNMSTTDVQISMNGFNPRTICVMIIG